MGKFIDLTGQKFGKLTVIERAEKPDSVKKSICAYWLCKCECGNEIVVKSVSLRNGNTKSCGCTNGVKDLTGKKIGRLTVIERAGSDSKGRAVWLCKCECGNEKVIAGYSLRNGNTKSCGCVQKEKVSEKMKEQMKILWQDEEMKWKMHYKGGITPISAYLRSLQIITQWKKDTYIRENSKCQLTGKSVHGGNSDVHHLKAFSTIVEEAHDLHNIKIKPQVKDYTQEELKLLEEYVGSWHKDTSNAVLLSEDVHALFHKLYGYGENTPEQFEEFRERYLAGEFKEILK